MVWHFHVPRMASSVGGAVSTNVLIGDSHQTSHRYFKGVKFLLQRPKNLSNVEDLAQRRTGFSGLDISHLYD